jgi:hypothetical protein
MRVLQMTPEEKYWIRKLEMDEEYHQAKMNSLKIEDRDNELNNIAYREQLELRTLRAMLSGITGETSRRTTEMTEMTEIEMIDAEIERRKTELRPFSLPPSGVLILELDPGAAPTDMECQCGRRFESLEDFDEHVGRKHINESAQNLFQDIVNQKIIQCDQCESLVLKGSKCRCGKQT